MNKPGHRAWYEQHNSSQHFTFRSKLSVNAQMTWRVAYADIVNGSYKEQNVLSPSESKDTSVAELPNTDVVVNQDDTFNYRKGMLMERAWVALFAICIQGLGKKKHRKGRKQRKISTLCELVPAPTPAPSSTPASIDRPVSSTRLPEPSEDAMPYGRMRYVGRVKERSLKDKMAKDPIEVIRKAVLRMLPRNKLRDEDS
ncbi:ankyrin repeat-containing protein [Tanacetum coccineum]